VTRVHRLFPALLVVALLGASCTPTVKLVPSSAAPSRSVTASGPAAAPGPNIVFIITDDETYAEAQLAATNTNLNADLVSKGITFTNAIIPNPLCCPSRTSILRGQLSSKTGVWTNSGPYGGWQAAHDAGDETSTVATWLHGAGYRTALIGKYLNGYEKARWVPPGWDYWRAEEINDSGGGYYNYRVSENGTEVSFGSAPADYSDDVMTGFATSFIASTPKSQPLFMYVGYRSPHGPSTAAPRYTTDPRCDGASTTGLPDYRVAGAGAPRYILDAPRIPASFGSTAPVDSCRSLLAVDDGVGAITRALASAGRLADTMLVFISDNGYMYGEHRWIAKRVPYESSIHVPLIIRYDPLTADRAGTTNAGVVANIDLAPTAAALAGITPPLTEDGQSLVPLLNGTARSVRKGVLLEGYSQDKGPRMPSYCGWRTTRYVYVRYLTGEQQLYDLAADPYEMKNLATDPAWQGLRQRLASKATAACMPPPPDWPS
jgi:N-acetylglucosamine-6-sulfatase